MNHAYTYPGITVVLCDAHAPKPPQRDFVRGPLTAEACKDCLTRGRRPADAPR